MSTNTVALLGVGRMGAAFVDRWREAGRDVVLWNRTASSAAALAGPGIQVAESPEEAVNGVEVVVTMLTSGDALTSVMLEQGALAAMRPGSVLVDLSTIDVPASMAVAQAAEAAQVEYLRGAVSGTPPVVRAGNATLMLSGSDAAYQAAQEVLNDLSSKHALLGTQEEARIVKIALNAMLAATTQVLAESITLAEAAGVSRDVFLDALGSSTLSSPFLGYKGTALRNRDYSVTFTTANMRKDMMLALGLADDSDVPLPVATVVLDRLDLAIEAGYGSDDFLSLACIQQSAAGQGVDHAPRS